MSEPRAYTVDEMRSMLLDYFRGLVKHWATTDLRRPEFAESVKKSGEVMYRMEGLVHSILVTLDGCSMATPSFDLVPSPHPSDAADHREHGENWWPEKVVINECMLHDLWHAQDKAR